MTTTARAESGGAKSFFWVSQVGTGTQVYGPSFTDFPGQSQGTGLEVERMGLKPASVRDAGIGFTCYATAMPQHQPHQIILKNNNNWAKTVKCLRA